MMRVLIKIIKHRARGDKSGEEEDEGMLPVALEKILVGEYEKWKEKHEDEWRDTKSDIGMKTETEYESGESEMKHLSGTEAAEEKIKRKGEEK